MEQPSVPAKISPIVPSDYYLHNTFFSGGTLDETRSRINEILKNVGVYDWSPDVLFCSAKACIGHELITFHVLLFHSDLGEFAELRLSRGDLDTFISIETTFTSAGFTASTTNHTRIGFSFSLQLPPEFSQADLAEIASLNPVDKFKEEFAHALNCTEDNASFREILVGVRISAHLLCQDAAWEHEFDSCYKFLTRLFDFVMEASESELRCVALDALAESAKYKIIVRALAVQSLQDTDPLVRFIAERILV